MLSFRCTVQVGQGLQAKAAGQASCHRCAEQASLQPVTELLCRLWQAHQPRTVPRKVLQQASWRAPPDRAACWAGCVCQVPFTSCCKRIGEKRGLRHQQPHTSMTCAAAHLSGAARAPWSLRQSDRIPIPDSLGGPTAPASSFWPLHSNVSAPSQQRRSEHTCAPATLSRPAGPSSTDSAANAMRGTRKPGVL